MTGYRDGGDRPGRVGRRPPVGDHDARHLGHVHKPSSAYPSHHSSRAVLHRKLDLQPFVLRSVEDVFAREALLTEGKFTWMFNKFADVFDAANIGTYEEYVQAHRQHFLAKFLQVHQADQCWDASAYQFPSCDADADADADRDDRDEGSVSYRYDPEIFPSPEDGDLSSSSFEIEYPASLVPHGLTYTHGLVLSNISPGMSTAELRALLPPSIVRLHQSLPDADKQFHRFAWVHLNRADSISGAGGLATDALRPLEAKGVFCTPCGAGYVHKARVSLIMQDHQTFKSQLLVIYRAFNHARSSKNPINDDISVDAMLHQLRTRHNYCALCSVACGCPEELIQRCGNLHLYDLLPLKEDSERSQEEQKSSDSKGEGKQATTTVDFCHAIALCQMLSSLGNMGKRRASEEEEDAIVDDIVRREDVKQLDADKFQCGLCDKLFRGADFVVKHVRGKHPEHLGGVQRRLRTNAALTSFLPFAFAMWPTALLSLCNKDDHAHPHDQQQQHSRHDDHPTDGHHHQPGAQRRRLPHFTARTYKDWDAVAVPAHQGDISYEL
jgi:hypothetical protein